MIEQQPLSAEQIKAGIEAARTLGARELALITIAANHGLRVSELAKIKNSDVDLASSTIHVKPGKGSITATEKMNPATVEAIKGWLDLKPTSPYLFPSPANNGPISRVTVYNVFVKIAKRAGFPIHSRAPHAIRHSVGQKLADEKVPVQIIQRVLRHKSINSTMHYFKVTQRQADEVRADKLGW